MAEDAERTWVRLCAAIDGFRLLHGGWPTRVLLPEPDLRALREVLLTPESLGHLQEKVRLEVQRGDEVVAADDQHRRYACPRDEVPPASPTIDAEEWLGVRPDRPTPIEP